MNAQENSRLQQEKDGDTEQRILQAARTVFVRHGTAGARMQEIAAEAGVNQALLHYYFRSKDRLAEAVFREAAGRLVPAALAILGSDAAIERKIEQFVHIYIDTVRQSPFIPGYVLSELHHHPERLVGMLAEASAAARDVAAHMLQRIDVQLREGAAAGTLRPIAPQQLVLNMLGLCVIPFIARPMLSAAFGMDDASFERLLDERRAELPGFILSGLRP